MATSIGVGSVWRRATIGLVCCCVGAITTAGEVAVDFSAGVKQAGPNLEAKEILPEDGALRVDYDPAAAGYVELAFRRPTKLPAFDRLEGSARVRFGPEARFRAISLRLRDAKGETFQLPCAPLAAPGPDGVVDVHWSLDRDTRLESWGGNNDKAIDHPVQLAALAFGYERNSPASSVTFLSLTLTSGQAAPATRSVETAGAAETVPALSADLSKGAKRYLPVGDRRPKELPWTDAPDGNGKGVEIRWTPTESKYFEVALNAPLRLPEFSKVAVTVRFHAPEGCPVRNIGLRLRDKSGEVFQYSKTLDFRPGGVIEATWDIAAGVWKNSWGGNKDNHFDQPGQVFGFGVDYHADPGEAVMHLLGVSARVSGGEGEVAVRPFYRFSDESLFRKRWGPGRMEAGEKGWLAHGLRSETSFRERMDELRFFAARPERIELDVEGLSGRVEAYWEFRDATGGKFRSPALTADPGPRTLAFDLSAALAGAKPPIAVERLSLAGKDGADAAVWLTGCRVAVRQSLAEAVDFDLRTGNDLHVLKAGREDALAFAFTNRSGRAGAFQARIDATHFSGATHTESFPLALEPGGTRVVHTDWRPERFGHYDVVATVTEDGGASANRASRRFAYLDPAGPTPGYADGFLFGVASHPHRWSPADQRREAAAAALAGAKVVRAGLDWNRLEPERGAWNFGGMDALVDVFGDVGIELQTVLGYTAKWAATPEQQADKDWLAWSRAKPDMDAWRAYVRAMAGRYRGRIRYWEVWNEPDLRGFSRMTLDEYSALQQASFEEIKRVSPEASVMTGGFATMSEHPGRHSATFHEDFLKRAAGAFDVHAYHEHGAFPQFAALVDGRFLPMRGRAGTVAPWYANETAAASVNGAERAQALALFKKFVFAWSRGAIGYTWYDLRDDGFDPHDNEHNFGLFTNDFQPKPVLSVFNTLAARFRDMRYLEQLDVGGGRWAFAFDDAHRRAPGERRTLLVPAWDENAFGGAAALVVRTDARRAERLDLMGNRSPVALVDGLSLLDVDADPATFVFHGAGAEPASVAGRLLDVAADGVAVPGRRFAFGVKLFNPLATARRFDVRPVKLPKGFPAGAEPATATLAPGETREVSFGLAVDETFRPPYGTAAPLTLEYAVDGTPWRGAIRLPVNAAVAVPPMASATALASRAPDFTLDTVAQVVSITANDPALAHRVWRNSGDLGAKVWLGVTDAAWHIAVDVTDDRHVQPHSGSGVWKGDNVQMAFQLPGQDGYWELGLTRLDDGTPEAFVFQAPSGRDAAAVAKAVTLETTRQGDVTAYRAVIPLEAVGLTRATARSGFRFNLLVNDDDGEGRDGWIHIAPGIGAQKNPDRFPFVVFD